MSVNRRRFLRGLLIVPLSPGLMRPAAALSRSLTSPAGIRSERWTTDRDAFLAGEREQLALSTAAGGLTLPAGAPSGTYVSPVHRFDIDFNALALLWQAELAPGSAPDLSLRVSEDGRAWGNWTPVPPASDAPCATPEMGSELMFSKGRYVQWSVHLVAQPGPAPLLTTVTVLAIDSTASPVAETPSAMAPAASPSAVAPPTIISRASWGCPLPYSSPDWPPAYRQVTKIVIHHTATANDYANGAEAVRAIWQYHAVGRGWGDIGYNFLVDRFGNAYEGRLGGDDVIAGHALCYNPGSCGISVIGNFSEGPVSPAALDTLTRLLAWVAHRRDIDPLGSSQFVDRVTANICAHRDLNGNRGDYGSGTCYMSTECPGTDLYNRLTVYQPTLRTRAWALFPDYAATWLSHNTPAAAGPGDTVTVALSVVNRGRLVWKTAWPNQFDIGYHWYRADGTQYVQQASEDQRAGLPSDLAYGQQATVNARLTTPHEAGTYTLKWDVVQEGVTWFERQGVTPLTLSVLIQPPILSVQPSTLRFLADATARPLPQTLTVQNTGQGTLQWSASSDQSWCKLTPEGGIGEARLSVSVDPAGLKPGMTHQATIVVTAPGADASPQTVSVQLVYSDHPLSKSYFPFMASGGSLRQ